MAPKRRPIEGKIAVWEMSVERYEDQHDIFGDISGAYDAVVEEVYDLAGMSQNQLASLHHQFAVDERYSRCIAMVVVIDMEKAGFGMP